MIYTNPVIKGFYADPSVCRANGKYYLVTSTMQFFPGVPVFESEDLVNWTKIGHCLTRKSQIMLEEVDSSGGVFAPTIRFHDGVFYMTTTNSTTQQHFIVYTDDIYGEWSEPIYIDQDGIDPSLLFDDGKVYFMSNGSDDFGSDGVVQCEIDIKTGKKLTPSRTIWKGTGGRFLEAPHLYKINGEYYLLAAEGGTEYGHMATYARGKSPYGPFESYPKNPVLTNRNLGGYEIQGVGHGDLIQDDNGEWHIIHLGFRQSGQWSTYHHLGRETFLTPITFGDDGWFTAGRNGTTELEYEISGDFEQKEKRLYTFENTEFNLEWCFLRHPDMTKYTIEKDNVILRGTNVSLNDPASPTFMGIRQTDFKATISCDVEVTDGMGGLTIYMDENHHYDVAIRKKEDGYEAIGILNIGTIKAEVKAIPINKPSAKLIIVSDNYNYNFYVDTVESDNKLAWGQTRYLSSEVAGGFTGVFIGLYAYDKNNSGQAKFTNFSCEYQPNN